MLRARRQGFFKREYEISTAGSPLTRLTGGRKESCEFTVDGAGYRVERDGRKRFELHGAAGRLAVAEREAGRRWRLSAPTGNLQLVRPSIWRSAWEIHQRGSARGSIRHDGGFGRNFLADVPSDVPVALGIFAFYVVLVQFERASAAAASG